MGAGLNLHPTASCKSFVSRNLRTICGLNIRTAKFVCVCVLHTAVVSQHEITAEL